MSLFLCGVGKILPVHRYIYFFHILVLWEYWVQAERRTPLKLVLGSIQTVAFSISSHEQTQYTYTRQKKKRRI